MTEPAKKKRATRRKYLVDVSYTCPVCGLTERVRGQSLGEVMARLTPRGWTDRDGEIVCGSCDPAH